MRKMIVAASALVCVHDVSDQCRCHFFKGSCAGFQEHCQAFHHEGGIGPFPPGQL